MQTNKTKEYYRRNLPHIQPIGAAFFVTFRLKDSIPKAKIWNLKNQFDQKVELLEEVNPIDLDFQLYNERKRFFAQYDDLLDEIEDGPIYLQQPEIAQLVADQMHRFDGDLYRLIAYSILPNHAHILIDTSIQVPRLFDNTKSESLEFDPLSAIMKKIKGPSAVYANRLLDRKGQFWQRESYDHYIRTGKEFNRVIAYILNNPVKARLVLNWENHPFTFVAKQS